MELTARQQEILRVLTEEYVNNGQPVGSNALLRKYNLGVSPATVRNEMARLEEAGYLTHPHTSAGRVPTEKGYRYFVQRLMRETKLSSNERLMIEHQFHQARLELDQWMRLSAAVLAHTTQSASLVTSPKINRCLLKHLELISIQDNTILLVLVFQEGTVKQQIINVEQPYNQDDLRIISNQLTDLWTRADAATVQLTTQTLSGLGRQVATVVLEMMNRLDRRQTSDMYHDGLLHLLEEANLADSETLQQVIRVVEEQRLIDQLVGEALTRNGVQIIIGGEGRWDNLSQVSIVIARYGKPGGVTGALGVVGPTRMSYGRAVSIVQYMSRLMSNLLVDLYGLENNTQTSN